MKNYDPKKPSKFITYLDMNNLYGWTLSGYLAYGRFKWLKNVDGFDVNLISKKCPIGYIFEADPKYPDELLVLHDDYQFQIWATKLIICFIKEVFSCVFL